MTRTKLITRLSGAAAVSLIALTVACGGSNSSATPAASATPATGSGQSATVSAESEGNLGKILVGAQGRTLYLFQKDSGTHSSCFDACAGYWPPLRASGKPTVGDGLDASLIGTSFRSDGRPQVTYNGHPVYLFSGDQKPGDTTGQGLTDFGGSWYALSAVGDQVTGQTADSSGGSGY